MKIKSTFEYRAIFDTAEEVMKHGSKIHEALLGDPYIDNTVILTSTEIVKVIVFLDDFRGDTEARDKLIKKIMEAIDDD